MTSYTDQITEPRQPEKRSFKFFCGDLRERNMSTNSEKLYKDYELGRFHGNLFAFLADKFPAEIHSHILENYFVVVDCTITIRLMLKTSHLGYFIKLSENKYAQIKSALDEIYKDIPKLDEYPDVYNSESMSNFNRRYPTVHNDEKRPVVVWLKRL